MERDDRDDRRDANDRDVRRRRCASRKRNGDAEPVDVNKIVRAVNRCCDGPARRRRHARRDQDHRRPLRRRHHARAGPAVDPDGGGADRRGAAVRAARRAAARDVHRQGGPRTRRSTRSRSRSRRAPAGAGQRAAGEFVAAQRAQAERRHRSASATASSNTSACAPCTTATCCKHPKTRAGDRDAAAVLPAHRLRAVARRWPRRWSSTGCSRRWSTCPARRRCSTPARGTSSSRAASCSIRPEDELEASTTAYTDVAMLSKFSGGIGLAYHRVRSRGSLIESTNGHSNGIVPWLKTLDARSPR